MVELASAKLALKACWSPCLRPLHNPVCALEAEAKGTDHPGGGRVGRPGMRLAGESLSWSPSGATSMLWHLGQVTWRLWAALHFLGPVSRACCKDDAQEHPGALSQPSIRGFFIKGQREGLAGWDSKIEAGTGSLCPEALGAGSWAERVKAQRPSCASTGLPRSSSCKDVGGQSLAQPHPSAQGVSSLC